jgi:hypothetical protein
VRIGRGKTLEVFSEKTCLKLIELSSIDKVRFPAVVTLS